MIARERIERGEKENERYVCDDASVSCRCVKVCRLPEFGLGKKRGRERERREEERRGNECTSSVIFTDEAPINNTQSFSLPQAVSPSAASSHSGKTQMIFRQEKHK